MGLLEGKIVIVTGGGTGIGTEIAARFIREGAHVAICGRRREVLEQAARAISAGAPEASGGDRVFFDTMDVTVPDQVEAFVASVVQRFGGVDILVNNAGIMRFGPLTETGEDVWESLIDTNLYGPLRMMRAVVPHMRTRGGGSIVNLSSIAGHKALPNVGGYCTSKAALTMMSQVAALEWASDNVRVNIIAPGVVEETELADPIFGPEGVSVYYDKLRSLHPLGRSGVPRDVAEMALFLASEQSSWVSGVMIPLDGGRHLATNRPPV